MKGEMMKKEVVRKKSKTVFAILIWMLVVVVCFLSLGGCVVTDQQQQQNARNSIKRTTGIEVPTNSKVIFLYYDNAFVNGRQEELTVFEFEEEPTNWLEENKFLGSEDELKTENGIEWLAEENKFYFFSYFKVDKIESKKIPKEYVPDFETDYRRIRTNNVYFFYYPSLLRLTVYIAWS